MAEFCKITTLPLHFFKVDCHDCEILDDELKMILYKITEKRRHNTSFEFSTAHRKLKDGSEITPKIIRKVIFNLEV